MKDNLTFQNIILNHFNTPEDKDLQQQVEALRGQSAENEQFYQDVKTIWETAALTKKLHQVNPGLSVNAFKARLEDHGLYHPRRFDWRKIAAAAILIILAGYWFYPKKAIVHELVKETKQQIDSVYLSDGTKVILAKNTTIRYPEILAKDFRQMTLVKGQAFFKVHRDVKRPFSVAIGQSKVSVLGTSFNINYNNNAINLAVKTGKVMFSPNEISSSAVLIAGQALKYDLQEQRIEWVNGTNANSWATKELQFTDMPLEEVCKELSSYYNVNIVVHNKMHSAKKFNARFKDSSLEEIFTVLKQTYKIRIDTNDQVITIKNL